MATRKRILDMVANDGLLVAGFHMMPFPGLGYVERAGGAYRWVPHSYQMNLYGSGGFAPPRAHRQIDSSVRCAIASASGALRRASSEASASCCHGAQQPRRAPGAQRVADQLLAREMHRRRAALHGEVDRVAAVDGEPHLVQVGDLADRRRHDRRRRRAAGARLAEFSFDIGRAAGERRIEHAVERQRPTRRTPPPSRRRARCAPCPGRKARACGSRCARRAGRRRAATSSAARASGAMVSSAARISSSISRPASRSLST